MAETPVVTEQTIPLSTPAWVIKPLVAEAVYTARAEFLEFFYQEALRAATRRSMSTVLLGRRRMGKTKIFKRVVNRLFFSEERHQSQGGGQTGCTGSGKA